MKDNFINKKNIIVPIISSLLIVIVGKLDINWYFKYLMFPYFMLLVSMSFLTFKNKDKSLKAYILLTLNWAVASRRQCGASTSAVG